MEMFLFLWCARKRITTKDAKPLLIRLKILCIHLPENIVVYAR